MKHSSYIKMEDIAKRLNVSVVTVSKALNGHPDISDVTSRKIKKIANELGYIPNYYAKNIVSNHSKVIGIIVPNISQLFYTNIIDSFYQIAFEMGYEIILKLSQGNPFYEKKLIESLLSMRVDGIIISVSNETKDKSIYHQAKKMGVALTFINNILEDFSSNKVTIDDFEAARSATLHAINIGYKKIAFISGHQDEFNILNGFKSAFRINNIKIESNLIFNVDKSTSAGSLFMELYKLRIIPECFFCTNYSIMMGVIKAADSVGIKIHGDIELIGVGSNSSEDLPVKPLVYIEQPIRDFSRKAFELTIQNLSLINEMIPQEIKMPARCIFRNDFFDLNEDSQINYKYDYNMSKYID